MTSPFNYVNADFNLSLSLKMDVLSQWIDHEWIPSRSETDLLTLWISKLCLNDDYLHTLQDSFELPEGYRFTGFERIACPVVANIASYKPDGSLNYLAGAFVYTFTRDESEIVEVLVLSTYFNDVGQMLCVACVSRAFIAVWTAFSNECIRLSRMLSPAQHVTVIGGRTSSFVPTVTWDEIILPQKLKQDLLEDVESFFNKGVHVYRRLKLKPFRKLLLTGVPGTGKTMLCSALARWALERQYVVIYVSSADHLGATFAKIEQALSIASNSEYPTMILLEELDAYLNAHEKALILNVLDGSEALTNEFGTLLIATTNYPEAIDERVLKRPGRLDRIFIIPETRSPDDAEKMLRQYLGEMWSDSHRAFVAQLVGYPGAFIREVAVYALTQVACADMTELPVDLLERSFRGLKEQIDAKEEFMARRFKKTTIGLTGS
jgi:ATP-dependent 26S proteasome regulatory subunit